MAVADPWFPQAAPTYAETSAGEGEKATGLTTVARSRADDGEVDSMAVAAWVGPVEQVVSWQPMIHDEQHLHLDSDSALGAFYEITEAEVLQPVFEDDLHMKGVYDRALTELIVPMEADGRVVAAAFLRPDGSGPYPAWVGFDRDMKAVAVLVDLEILEGAVSRVE